MSLPQKTDNALLEAALAYARAGLPIFPAHEVIAGLCSCGKNDCPSPGKHPRIKDWANDASTEENQIRLWWRRWPTANIGMPTGYRTDRLVLDLDPRHGCDSSLAVIEEEYGPLPTTLGVQTGGGGRHLHFQLRGLDIRNSTGVLAPGIDVRGVGGLVLLPPSLHLSGNRYGWINGKQVLDPPEWLEKKLLQLKSSPSVGTNGTGGEKVPAGKRNDWLTRRAGSYRWHGDTPGVIFQKIKLDYMARCEHGPPISDEELRTITNSVGRYAPAEPGAQGPPRAKSPLTSFPSNDAAAEPQEVETIPGRLPVTEQANAERLAAKHRTEIRFASDRKIWCVWNGTHWAVNDVGRVMRWMTEIARGIYLAAANEPGEHLRKALAQWAKQSESQRVQESSVGLARWISGIEVPKFGNVFDLHPHLLNVRNGTLDLPTGEFRPHQREDYITKIVDIEYHPGAKCPQFNKFLAETFDGSVPLIGYATRLAGYFLTGLTSEQKWWMFHGPTASGKSTFIKILHGLMGPYALALPENYFLISKHDTTDFVTANLAGVRLATCVETNEGRRLNVARIKTITGEDMILAQLKYQNHFEFKPQCKLVLVTNYPPHVPAGDDALWRRLKVLPFTVTVPEEKRTPGLAEKLLSEEGAGILNWAIAGYLDCHLNGLQEPRAVTDAIAEYRSSEDIVQNFLQECCEQYREQDPPSRVARKDIYAEYLKWCKAGNLKPMSAKKLASELRRLGIGGDAGDRFWFNIRLREEFNLTRNLEQVSTSIGKFL